MMMRTLRCLSMLYNKRSPYCQKEGFGHFIKSLYVQRSYESAAPPVIPDYIVTENLNNITTENDVLITTQG